MSHQQATGRGGRHGARASPQPQLRLPPQACQLRSWPTH